MRSRGALDEVVHAEEVIIGVAVHEATTTAEHVETEANTASGADNVGGNEEDTPNNTELGLTSRASGSRSRSGTVPGLRPEGEVYTEVSALVSAEAATDGSVSRSRSGSITRLRAKRATMLGLRGASGQNADARLQEQQEKKHKEKQRVPAPITVPKRSTQVQDQETVRSPPATTIKTPKIMDLARAIAQRLRRRPSGEESEAGGGTGNESGGGGKLKKNKEGLKVLRRPKGIRRAHSASTAYQLDGKGAVGSDVAAENGTTGSGTLPPRTSSDPALPLIPMLPLPRAIPGHVPPEDGLEALNPSNIPLPKSPSPSISPPSSFRKADNEDVADRASTKSEFPTQPNSPTLDPVVGLDDDDVACGNEDAAPILSASVLLAALDEASNVEPITLESAEKVLVAVASEDPAEGDKVERNEHNSVHEAKPVEDGKPSGLEEKEETT